MIIKIIDSKCIVLKFRCMLKSLIKMIWYLINVVEWLLVFIFKLSCNLMNLGIFCVWDFIGKIKIFDLLFYM